MATNQILPFASTDTGTNLLTQAEYTADAQRTTGNQPGIARSKLVNKSLRQASLLAAGLAEFIADYQSNNVTDSLTPQNIADYLLAALQGSLAVTPPQFDNDTSLATTAFVQRALGNFTNVQQYTNQTVSIPAAQVGRVIILGGGFNTVTLPDSNACPIGSTFEFFSQSGTHTVKAPVGQILAVGAQNTGNSVVVSGSDYFTVVNQTGNVWCVTAGTPMLVNAGGFASNKAQSGYTKLPNGIILQWGRINAGMTGGMFDVTLPITFPNAGWVGVACDHSSSVTGSDINAVDFVSSTTMRVWCCTNADTVNESNFWWFAVGN